MRYHANIKSFHTLKYFWNCFCKIAVINELALTLTLSMNWPSSHSSKQEFCLSHQSPIPNINTLHQCLELRYYIWWGLAVRILTRLLSIPSEQQMTTWLNFTARPASFSCQDHRISSSQICIHHINGRAEWILIYLTPPWMGPNSVIFVPANMLSPGSARHQWPFSLAWFIFNPSMDM